MEAERRRQIEEIYHRALDRPTHEREEFVTQSCAGDTLLKEEVNTLLMSHDIVTGDLSQSPALETTEFLEMNRATTVLNDTGEGIVKNAPQQFVGHYQLLREIGRGGMGSVYLARRADDQYRKRVAIKLIRSGIGSDEIIRRFRNERQILAELDHPHIARFLEGGTTAEGRPYFVMEYIAGSPIIDYCDTNRLSINERLRLFRDACSAVQYAHQRLVIHRDIKPSNILVTEEGVVKLLDFGLAKLLDTSLADQTVETAAQVRMMTPEYASPEQIRGERVTTATDVYSLGMVLYELLCGYRPYRFVRRHWDEIERVVCQQEPIRPSAALSAATARNTDKATRPIETDTVSQLRGETMRNLQRRLAMDLDNIAMMALRKEPERRYISVEHLSDDVRRYLEGLPVLARPNTLSYRALKFIRRNKVTATAAMLTSASLILATSVTTWQARAARRERDKAERRFSEVRKLANAVLFKYHDGVEKLAGSTPVREMMVKDALEYLDTLTKESGNDPSLLRELADAYEKVGKVQGSPALSSIGDFASGLKSQKKALAIRESLVQANAKDEKLRSMLAVSYLHVTQLLVQSGESDEALVHLEKARLVLEKLTAEHPTMFNARANLGTTYSLIGSICQSRNDLPKAVEYFRKNLGLSEQNLAASPSDPERRRDLAIAHLYMGDGLYAMNKLTEAVSEHRTMLEISEALATANPNDAQARRDVGVALQRLAMSQERAGDYRSALENYRKGKAMDEQAAAADPANVLTKRDLFVSYLKIGKTLAAMGELEPALVHLRKMATIAESLATDSSNAGAKNDLSIAYYTIGETLAKKGDLREALQSYQKSLAIDEALAAKDKSDLLATDSVAQNHRAISDVLLRLGGVSGAEAGYRKALEIYEPLAAKNPTDESLRRDQALVYEGLGNVAATLALTTKSKPEQIKHWGEARSRYQQSLDVWRDLQKRQVLRFTDLRKPDELEQKLAKCEAALPRLSAK